MIKAEKSDQFLRTRQSTDANPKMTQMVELSDNDFKATTTMIHNHPVKIKILLKWEKKR